MIREATIVPESALAGTMDKDVCGATNTTIPGTTILDRGNTKMKVEEVCSDSVANAMNITSTTVPMIWNVKTGTTEPANVDQHFTPTQFSYARSDHDKENVCNRVPGDKRVSKLSASAHRASKALAKKTLFDVSDPPKSIINKVVKISLRNKGKTGTQYVCLQHRRNGCDRKAKLNNMAHVTYTGAYKPTCYIWVGVMLSNGMEDEGNVPGKDFYDEMHAIVVKLTEETNY